MVDQIVTEQSPTEALVEELYIEKHPEQDKEILSYLIKADDREKFRQDLKTALDSSQVVEFTYDTTLLDALPTYKLVDAPSSQE